VRRTALASQIFLQPYGCVVVWQFRLEEVALTRSGNSLRVLIATPFGRGGRGGMDSLTDLVIETLAGAPVPSVRGRAVATYGPEIKMLMPFVFFYCLLRVASAKLRGEVDVLHINVAWAGSVYRKAVLALFARALGIPYVVHIHGSRFHETWPSPRAAMRRVVDEMLKHSAGIVVLGRYWSDHVVKNLPFVANKVHVLPNATRSVATRARNHPRERRRVQITFLGALGARKGSLLLIEALSRLTHPPHWEATIAGNGDVAGHVVFAGKCGVAKHINFPGWLDRDGVDKLLGRTDIFVLPSFAENLPMAIIEAFAHGVPVISTPVGSIPDVVEPGVTGLLTPAGDVDALTKALRQLLDAPDLRVSMGQAARRVHAERFEISAYVKCLADIWYEAALRGDPIRQVGERGRQLDPALLSYERQFAGPDEGWR
jgi:glycosyltransferase involved in cell wall biosynthesis